MTIEGGAKMPSNPESRGEVVNARILLSAFKRGITEDEHARGVIAYHATSVESLAEALRSGVLPGITAPSTLHAQGDIFLMPLLHRIPNTRRPSKWLRSLMDKEDSLTLADLAVYAQMNAEQQYVLASLGISIGDQDAGNVISDMIDNEDFDAEDAEIVARLRRKAGTKKRLEELIQEARGRKGVLISIKREALGHYGIGAGDHGEGDIKLMTGYRGFDIKYIMGAKALGDDGVAFMKSLRGLR